MADLHPTGPLSEIILLLAAAILIVSAFRKIRLSPVLGYLAAGMAIGPFGFAILNNAESAQQLAEFGVVFLLFVIGLDLSLERLQRMRRHVFGFGTAQVLLTALVLGGLCAAIGMPPATAVIVGGGLALSSTAIVLQVLQESGQKTTQVGRLSLATLILQDLAVIPLLVLVPLLAGNTGTTVLRALSEATLKAVAAMVLIVLAGRLLLKPLLGFIAARQHQELFTATTLLILLASSYFSMLAGLSPALGAFMAGLLIAETEFRPQVESDIMPFKGLLLALFFITVGMNLDILQLRAHALEIFAMAAVVILIKSALIYLLCRRFGFTRGVSLHGGLLLAQGGEFAFVLFTLAAHQGLLSTALAQQLVAVVTLTMAATPLLNLLGHRLGRKFDVREAESPHSLRETQDLRDHVIIAGYGRVGRTLGRLLDIEHIPYIALDINPTNVSAQRAAGHPVFYGNASHPIVLKALGLGRARAVVVSHGDPQVSVLTVRAVRSLSIDVPIIARSHNIDEVVRLEQEGANLAVAEMFETSLQLGGLLLKQVGIADTEILRLLENFRAGDYALTRRAEAEGREMQAAEFVI
jgi:CPA2 family monovalent cation:H+ antiporter-2